MPRPLDNRHIEDLLEEDPDELEKELDDAAEDEGGKSPKKSQKNEEEEDDEDIEDDSEEDEDDSDEEEDDDEDEEEDEIEKKRLADEAAKEKKARESQREALVQNARNKQLTDKIREAGSIVVTEEELKVEAAKENLDFDTLDNFQKSMLKRTILAERKFSTVSEVVVEEDKLNEWSGKIDTFLDEAKDNTKLSRLVGHEHEFKSFAMKEGRRGMEFEDLARSFLFDLPVKKKHKGSLLLKGGGGAPTKRKQLDAEDTTAMRKVSPVRLTDMMKKGKVKIEI